MSGQDVPVVPTPGTDGPAPADAPPRERRSRRWGWPVALLGTLALVLGLRLFLHLGQPGSQAQGHGAEAAASGAGPGAALGTGSGGVAAALAETSPQLAQATQTAARVARATTAVLAAVTQRDEPPPPPERSLALCGLGRLTVTLPPPPSPGNAASRSGSLTADSAGRSDMVSATAAAALPAGLPPALGRLARADVWPDLLAALEAQGQPLRARAAAQVLRVSGVVAADDGAARLQAASSAPPATRADQAARARALAELARMARPVGKPAGQPAQGDATVLRWALALCSGQARPTAECRRISPRDLVRLAPQDSASWLALAASASAPLVERQAALQRAAAAPQFTGLGTALAQQINLAWPPQRPGFVQVQVLAVAQAVERSLVEPGLPAVLQACSALALAAPRSADSAHALCVALARQMQTRGPDLSWLSAAATLGQRLGWPEPERRALRREEVALADLQAAPAAVTEQPLSCPALAWTRGQLRGASQLGELGWLRQRRAVQTGEPAPGQAARASTAAAPAASAAAPAATPSAATSSVTGKR